MTDTPFRFRRLAGFPRAVEAGLLVVVVETRGPQGGGERVGPVLEPAFLLTEWHGRRAYPAPAAMERA